MKRFALVGNPNSGKTTLFNTLTGSTARVGNWPGVTVDKKDGVYKKLEEKIIVVDLPGIYSLSPYTSEEVISRNYILDEKPDCIINIVDATNLERNLYLSTQLLEIDIPVVVALNMIDVVNKYGDKINAEVLNKILKVPVIAISALKQENIEVLMQEALIVSREPRKAFTVLEKSTITHLIKDVATAFKGLEVDNPLFHAIKLAEEDELEVANHPKLLPIVTEFKNTFENEDFGTDFEALVADARYKYINKHLSPALVRKNLLNHELSTSDKIDKVLTHKWFGIPLFLLILFLMFVLVFSEDLFLLGAFGIVDENFVSFAGTPFEGLFYNGGINSPGVILFNFVDSLSTLLYNWLDVALSGLPEVAHGLLIEGGLAGLLAVLSFIPQILTLFFLFSFLEDTGYMARVAFILDRAFRKFGVSGRAILPMVMGFGCSVPATINTRTLATENEKIKTIRVIPFFSCGAKLPILTAIAGGLVAHFGIGNVDVITFSMYLIGMLTAIVAIIAMNHTVMRGPVPPFIMELPTYHIPQLKSLLVHLWEKLKHFVIKAFTIILASTFVIYFISHFSWTFSFLADADMGDSILASIGKILLPIFTPLGFGSQLSTWGWVFVVAAITGLIAKENVIATFGTLAITIASALSITVGDLDEQGITAVGLMIQATNITIPGLIGFIVFNMTTIPCFAAVATAKAELPKGKFLTTILFWLGTSYIVSSLIYLVGTYWWTIFIFAGVTIGIIFLIRDINIRKDRRKLA
ncbi:MAG: ferrous iron transport protein B [Bacillales bacterium]|jgi:ferrous iron transport protein B|nr:ferrous iron transport protein B [Bacillales bacterium]